MSKIEYVYIRWKTTARARNPTRPRRAIMYLLSGPAQEAKEWKWSPATKETRKELSKAIERRQA
jgi:hypothetical protein